MDNYSSALYIKGASGGVFAHNVFYLTKTNAVKI